MSKLRKFGKIKKGCELVPFRSFSVHSFRQVDERLIARIGADKERPNKLTTSLIGQSKDIIYVSLNVDSV